MLPKTASEPVIRERVILGTIAGNKIASLLDRGNMALEDGDWDKADSFFEDVLNNDSKNAEAYLGKTLAAEKCRTLDAFIRKRQELTKEADLKYGEVEFDHAYVQTQTAKYSIQTMWTGSPSGNFTIWICAILPRWMGASSSMPGKKPGGFSQDLVQSGEICLRRTG